MESEHQVPIWFFVGFLLLIYGLLIWRGHLRFASALGRASLFEGFLAGRAPGSSCTPTSGGAR